MLTLYRCILRPNEDFCSLVFLYEGFEIVEFPYQLQACSGVAIHNS